MIIVLPLTHESMEAQRFPYITLGLVLLNTFLFIITAIVAPDSQHEHYEREVELVGYYSTHLYLNFPDTAFAKLSPGSQQHIELIKKIGLADTLPEVNQNTALTDAILNEFMLRDGIEDEEEALEIVRQKEQETLDELIEDFEEAYEDDFYIKYGYIPARGGVFTIFSSIFLHGGFFHLLFNMLFLWLSGCNIEDLWGRIVYPILYLLGGILATLAYGWMYPDSPIPLIGASGAIAAVMGAFMIRMYSTKIHFFYLIFMLGIMRGTFAAPAYIMLPLWLLQQIWGVVSAGSASEVAFWAHIGGFIFGAIVATLIKVTGFEANVLAPALDKKTAIVDEHLAAGIEKLRDNDVNGAIQELKAALQTNPDDPIARSELSRAYFAKGNTSLAQREFKRAIFLYMKRGKMDDAIDQYLYLHHEMPQMVLDPPQQKKLAAALEQHAKKEASKYSDPKEAKEHERQMYFQAAFAYNKIVAHYHKKTGTLDHPDVVKALKHYGNLNLYHLQNPQEALKAYKILLSAGHPSPEEKRQIQEKVQKAMEEISQKANRAKLKQIEEARKVAEQKKKAEKMAHQKESRAQIPIPKRLKLLPATDAPAKYQVPSVAPLEANKVQPAEGGLDLKRLSEDPIAFEDISLMCVYQIRGSLRPSTSGLIGKGKRKKETAVAAFESTQEVILLDLFLKGQSRPYRIMSNRIAYTQFFSSNLQSNSFDNFRQFVLYTISNLYSVYVDQPTMNFLKTGKAKNFSSPEELAIHEKILWKQLRGAERFVCAQCFEVYWIDGTKIPVNGAKTKCAKCGQAMEIKRSIKKTQ